MTNYQPTLLYPNGNETILARVIDIQWKESFPVVNNGASCWYEIFYTENYDHTAEPDWKMIASVPIGTSRYEWRVGNLFKSKFIRVAICSVNIRGERSDMSISAANFSIKKSLPDAPAILSPVPGERYGGVVRIIFDDAAVKNNSSRRAKYYIYFRSNKANIPLSSVMQRVPVGTGPIKWDVSFLPPSDDYVLTAYMADDDGNKSSEVNVTDIKIVNEGFFLIDTKAPEAYIQINEGNEFTKDRNISVRLFAYDETTDAHALQFVEGEESGPAESPTELKFWTLSEEEGIKTLSVRYQDYGGNRSSESDNNFRSLFNIDNRAIADIALDKQSDQDIIWIGVNGENPTIYKLSPNENFVCQVNETINSLTIYNDVLYISVDTVDNRALVYRLSGNELVEAFSLTDDDSEILSMQSYKGKMYLGAENGSLYSYDESLISLVRDFDKPIDVILSDSSLLYILFRNSSILMIFDGTNFTEVEL